MNSKNFFVIVVAIAICLIGFYTWLLLPHKDKKPSNIVDESVRLEQLYQYVFANKSLTQLQKEERYKNYEGKWVQWTGNVYNVSWLIEGQYGENYLVIFSYIFDANGNVSSVNSVSKLSDLIRERKDTEGLLVVSVEFPKSQKQKLLSLNKDSLVTYQGKLSDSYQDITPLTSLLDKDFSQKISFGSGRILPLTDGRIISVKP